MSTAKRNSLLLLLLTFLLIQVLAMGLPGVVLSPGEPFALGSSDSSGEGGLGALFGENGFAWIIRGIWVLTLICIPLYIIVSLLTPEGRKRLRRDIFTIIFLLLFAELIPNLMENAGIIQEPEETTLPDILDQIATTQPTATFSPDPPAWISVATILLATILISALIIGGLIFLRRRKTSHKTPFEKLAGEAQNAMQAIQAGKDFKSTIIRCYQEMVKVLEEEKGIFRETAMTPREFESNLINKGLPQDSIITITRLFEKVRYGNLAIDTGEENLAFSSLSEIVNACHSLGAQHEIE